MAVEATTKPAAEAPPRPAFSAARANYVLLLLTAIYALNFLDRNVINILIEPIKRELQLSDTMLGLLAGFGFAAFYSVLGIPLGRWADRADRRSIIALGLLLWSAMTAFSGMAQSALQMAMARIGVGIGEASCVPASHALISDYFGKDKRPRALSIFATGTYLGVFLGYFIGGWVNHFYGWRAAFFVAGAPGLLLALVLRLTVAEPRRGGSDARAPAPGLEPVGDTLRFLARQTSYVLIVLGFCLTSYTNFSFSVWIPPFLARVHHLSSGEIGTYAGTIKGLLGIGGALLGGFAVERWAKADDRLKLLLPAAASALGGPALALFLLARSTELSLVALAVAQVLIAFHLGAIWALAQTVVRVRMRAFASALLTLLATLFGLGVGPLVIGMANDALAPTFGAGAIRYSLLTGAATSTLGALLFWAAAAWVRRDIARAGEG